MVQSCWQRSFRLKALQRVEYSCLKRTQFLWVVDAFYQQKLKNDLSFCCIVVKYFESYF